MLVLVLCLVHLLIAVCSRYSESVKDHYHMVCGDYVVYCFFVCLSVCHAVDKIDEVWQHISRRGVFRTGRNLAA